MAQHSATLTACDVQGRCVLCGSTACPYWAAVHAGREPAVDGTEDCASFYRGVIGVDELAGVVAS